MKKNKMPVGTGVKTESQRQRKGKRLNYDYAIDALPFGRNLYLIEFFSGELLLVDKRLITQWDTPKLKKNKKVILKQFEERYLEFCKCKEGLKHA